MTQLALASKWVVHFISVYFYPENFAPLDQVGLLAHLFCFIRLNCSISTENPFPTNKQYFFIEKFCIQNVFILLEQESSKKTNLKYFLTM